MVARADAAATNPSAALLAALVVAGGTAALVGVTVNEQPSASRAPVVGLDATPGSSPTDAGDGRASEASDSSLVNASVSTAPDRPPENVSEILDETPNATDEVDNVTEEAENETSEAENATEQLPDGQPEVTLEGSVRAYVDANATYTGRYYVNVTAPEDNASRPGIPEASIELVDERTGRSLANTTTGPNGSYELTVRHEERGPLELEAVADTGGANETRSHVLPTRVVAPAQAVALGSQESCVLTEAGNVDCWGQTDAGEGEWGPTKRGPGMGMHSHPVHFYRADAVEIAASYDHVCYRNASGNVDCRGPAGSSNDLVRAGGVTDYDGSDAVALATGPFEACVATEGGEARCWGNDFGGVEPLDVEGHVVDVAVGQHHRCALFAAGDVICEGSSGSEAEPYEGGDAVAVSAGSYHTCVLTEANGARCWGEDKDQLVDRREGVAGLEAIEADTCLLLVEGTVDCSGRDDYNETRDYEAGSVVDVAAGGTHTCSLLATSRVHCWGWNQVGESLDYPTKLWPSGFMAQGPYSTASP